MTNENTELIEDMKTLYSMERDKNTLGDYLLKTLFPTKYTVKLNTLREKISSSPKLQDILTQIENGVEAEIESLPLYVKGGCCKRHSARKLFMKGFDLTKGYKDDVSLQTIYQIDNQSFSKLKKKPEKVLDLYLSLDDVLHDYCGNTSSRTTSSNKSIIGLVIDTINRIDIENDDIRYKAKIVLGKIPDVEIPQDKLEKAKDLYRKIKSMPLTKKELEIKENQLKEVREKIEEIKKQKITEHKRELSYLYSRLDKSEITNYLETQLENEYENHPFKLESYIEVQKNNYLVDYCAKIPIKPIEEEMQKHKEKYDKALYQLKKEYSVNNDLVISEKSFNDMSEKIRVEHDANIEPLINRRNHIKKRTESLSKIISSIPEITDIESFKKLNKTEYRALDGVRRAQITHYKK